MKSKMCARVRFTCWLAVVAVVVGATMALGACGSGGDDKALFEKMSTVWKNKDTAGVKELYVADAVLYWNWPKPSGEPADMTSGIEEIGALVASGDLGYPTLYGDAVYTLDIPADKPIERISANYKGARFISAPVYVGTDLYMLVLEVRDGKIQSQFVEAMH